MATDTPAPSRSTRDAILAAALALFSQKGFEASSMREIAADVGVTQGAIYKHFAGKEGLLEAICAHMERRDAEQAEDAGVPVEVPTRGEAADVAARTDTGAKTAQGVSGAAGLAAFRDFTLGMLAYWASDPVAAPFRRMLEIDRFRNQRMRDLYRQYLGAGPLEYTQACLEGAGMPTGVARARSLELWGTFRLLLELVDAGELTCAQAHRELSGVLDALLRAKRG